MKKSALIFGLFASLFFTSCHMSPFNTFYKGNKVENRATNLVDISLELPDGTSEISENTYNIILFNDIHLGSKDGYQLGDDFFNYLDSIKSDAEKFPKFIIFLGDIADHGKLNEYERFYEITEKLKSDYGLTSYSIAGNHDVYNTGWKYWADYTTPGTSFYRFKTANFSWYFLDTATGTLGIPQFESLQKAMQEDKNTKIVCQHYPLTLQNFVYSIQGTTERNLLIELYALNNVKAVYTGHHHPFDSKDYAGFFGEYSFTAYKNYKTFALVQINEQNGTVTLKETVELK